MIVRRPDLSPTAKIVWLVIASHADVTGVAWPSWRTIQTEAGVSRATVNRALGELKAAGLITWKQSVSESGEPCGSNRYRPVWGESQSETGESLSETGESQSETGAVSTGDGGSLTERRGSLTVRPEEDPLTTTTELEPVKNTHGGAVPAQFDRFWAVYPRKAAKIRARAAWTKATKTHDPERLIEAAKVYAQRTAGEERRYLPHPTTWLSGERWDDEPTPPPMLSRGSDRQGDLLRSEAERIARLEAELDDANQIGA